LNALDGICTDVPMTTSFGAGPRGEALWAAATAESETMKAATTYERDRLDICESPFDEVPTYAQARPRSR
jgi:hypothetical protein